jgi:hypothetical protein
MEKIVFLQKLVSEKFSMISAKYAVYFAEMCAHRNSSMRCDN